MRSDALFAARCYCATLDAEVSVRVRPLRLREDLGPCYDAATGTGPQHLSDRPYDWRRRHPLSIHTASPISLCRIGHLYPPPPPLPHVIRQSSLCIVILVVTAWLWLERWTAHPKVEGSNPVRSTRKTFDLLRVKKVVLTRCRCSQPPVCIRTHTKDYARMLKIM